MLYFDIETVFREEVRDSLGRYYAPNSDNRCSIPPTAVAGTVSFVETMIKENRPCLNSLLGMEKAELAGKARKGVLDAINKEIGVINADPIPHKVKMIPECCEVVAVGYGTYENIMYGDPIITGTEEEIVRAFWRDYNEPHTVGWMIRKFDIPVMVAAAVRYDIEIPPIGQGYLDLRDRRPQDGKLRDICLAMGFDEDDKDPLKGGIGVADAWSRGDIDGIKAHCRVDLLRTAFLHEKYQGYLWQ